MIKNIILLSQATGHAVALVLASCIVAPLSINMLRFKNHCLLFTTGTFREDDGNFMAEWASVGYCGYTLCTGVLLWIVSLIQMIRMLSFLREGIDSSFLSTIFDSLLNLLMAIMTFISSFFVTLGFKTWCDAVTKRFPSCDESSVTEFDKAENIITSGFYVQFGMVQFGAWSSWVFCVLLTVLSTCKLCHYHELYVIRVSMARARQDILHNSENSSYERGIL